MDKATRIAVVEHAIRWANNMLAEVLSNHGETLKGDCLAALRSAVRSLGEADTSIRRQQGSKGN